MDTAQPQITDRFSKLMIFSSDHNFPSFAEDFRINYKTVMGYCNGIIEESYVVNVHHINTILAGNLLRGQDTVLLLAPQEPVYGGKRDVYLVKVESDGFLLDLAGEFIGKWHKVSTNEALHSDAWTCYPKDNTWYMAKMPALDL